MKIAESEKELIERIRICLDELDADVAELYNNLDDDENITGDDIILE